MRQGWKTAWIQANISKGAPVWALSIQTTPYQEVFGLILFVLWLWNETKTVMLRVHVVSFERWRGFSTISNKLLRSHRHFLPFALLPKVFQQIKIWSRYHNLSPFFLSIVAANCWMLRMENCQNNNTITHQMKFSIFISVLSPQWNSQTFTDTKASKLCLSLDMISTEHRSVK